MQTIAGLTLLELLEHIARTLYIMQLMFTPEDFITANSVSGAAAVTPLLVHMHRLSAVFLIGLKGAILVVQMKAPSVKPAVWLNQSVCWGLCAVLLKMNEPLFKKPDFYVNLAVQMFFGAAFMAAFLTDKPKKA